MVYDEYSITMDGVKDRYSDEVLKLFRNMFKHGSINPNLRLHYTDVREYLIFHTQSKLHEANNIADGLFSKGEVNPDDLKSLITILKETLQSYKQLVNIMDHPKIIKRPKKSIHEGATLNDKDFQAYQIHLMFKMMCKYSNTKVMCAVNDFLTETRNNIVESINDITSTITIFSKYLEKMEPVNARVLAEYYESQEKDRLMLVDIVNRIEGIFDDCTLIFCELMDAYVLRRFLDKKYITNAICYFGAQHVLNIIRFLVMKFQFKITHISYNKLDSIEELTKKIIITKHGFELRPLFYPPNDIQCSDITSFPRNFE
jgi:hypothetical protein